MRSVILRARLRIRQIELCDESRTIPHSLNRATHLRNGGGVMKPLIFHERGMWHCWTGSVIAKGLTPKSAYDCWVNLPVIRRWKLSWL